MVEFSFKRLMKGIIDVFLVILGIIWVWSLFTFAQGTMDNSMAAEEVTRYQLESLAVLIVCNIIIVVLFKFRKKIKETIDEEAK